MICYGAVSTGPNTGYKRSLSRGVRTYAYKASVILVFRSAYLYCAPLHSFDFRYPFSADTSFRLRTEITLTENDNHQSAKYGSRATSDELCRMPEVPLNEARIDPVLHIKIMR
jgi:hypothetical protein